MKTRTTCVTVALGLALVGCGSSGSTSSSEAPAPRATPTAAGTPQGEEPVPELAAGHVHGMGVNPADGRLYLATHAGLMVVDEGAVRRVGDATLDLMGFAVTGPDHFVASGHPGAADDLPDPVGLVESRDGGLSWQPLSLAGRSDFHTLGAAAGRVYGFDGVLRSTGDGTSWTDGDATVRPESLAVHPRDPDTVLATTEQGPLRSVDGGATFASLAGAPLLVFLSWPSQDIVWGVAPDGGVHRSGDGGATWQPTGQVGSPPEAFTAADADTVHVATARAVLRSRDGGRTFDAVATRG